jgi:invasion protein IalB
MPPKLLSAVFLTLLAVLCGHGPSAAQAPPPPIAAMPQPDRTTACYGDWVLRCDLKGNGERSCEVAQTIQDTQAQLLAQVTRGARRPAGNCFSPCRSVRT